MHHKCIKTNHSGNGPGVSNRSLGQKGGTETVTLTTTQLPAHNHSAIVKASKGGRGGGSTSPIDHYLNEGGSYRSSEDGLMAKDSVQVNNTGGG